MKTLEEIKREYARERGFMGLLHMEYDGMIEARDVDEVAKRYAKEVAMQSLKNASENADTIETIPHSAVYDKIDISTILDEQNIPEL